MAVTTETGKVSYAAGYAYDTITKGTQSFPFTATYDSETNCTIVEFGTCQHEFHNRKNGVVAVTLITVEDSSNSSNCQSTIFYTNESSVTTKKKYTGSPWHSTLVIQHNNNLGQKGIKVSTSTQIRCFPNSSSVDSGNALTYTGSGSVSVSLGNYNGETLFNEAFSGRKGVLSMMSWPATGYLRAFAFGINYSITYNPASNTSSITFSNAKVKQRGASSKEVTCSCTITAIPLDNTSGKASTTMTYSETSDDSVEFFYPVVGSKTITVQHGTNNEEFKQVQIAVDGTFTLYVSSSSKWTINAALTSPAANTGTIKSKQLGIPIDNGKTYDFYEVFIDDGAAWQRATLMFDKRTEWVKVQ